LLNHFSIADSHLSTASFVPPNQQIRIEGAYPLKFSDFD